MRRASRDFLPDPDEPTELKDQPVRVRRITRPIRLTGCAGLSDAARLATDSEVRSCPEDDRRDVARDDVGLGEGSLDTSPNAARKSASGFVITCSPLGSSSDESVRRCFTGVT